jgi:hypothetical protein
MTMPESFLMGSLVVFAIYITLPRSVRRKLAGYTVISDIVVSSAFIQIYATTGAVSGLEIAILASIIFSVSIRLIKWVEGYERYEINGSDSLYSIFVELSSFALQWIRGAFMALFTGRFYPPPPLNGQWVEYKPSTDWLNDFFPTKRAAS